MSDDIKQTQVRTNVDDGASLENGIRKNRLTGSCYSGFSVIGKGGMGTVLKVKDLNSGRQVVMKMAVGSNIDSDAVRFLLREAKITAQLEHPNITPVHELNCDAQGNIYFTMKYVQGDNLEKILEKIHDGDPEYVKKYSLDYLLDIFVRICDGMAFAHSKGVIHRDLKPANLMVGDFGEVLIMDWGICKVLTDSEVELECDKTINFSGSDLEDLYHGNMTRKVTQYGEIFGTPAYMAPEQIRGDNMWIDERTDIYALGGILYNILSLRLPVEEDDISLLFQMVLQGEIISPAKLEESRSHTLPHIRTIPESLSAVAMKALSVEQEDRYENVKQLQKEIRKHKEGFATEAEQAGHMKQLGLMLNRNVLYCVMALFIVSMMAVSAYKDERNRAELYKLRNYHQSELVSMRKTMHFLDAG
ncbi:MAG: serine/threonine protein kinase, partial [Lentisphaeraceae bacterium]|nr:serine/threonine protein kinase [Lentisphaeraceae bacterium]